MDKGNIPAKMLATLPLGWGNEGNGGGHLQNPQPACYLRQTREMIL